MILGTRMASPCHIGVRGARRNGEATLNLHVRLASLRHTINP
jgi:hypothetical protein